MKAVKAARANRTVQTLTGAALASLFSLAPAAGIYDYDKLIRAADSPNGRSMFSGPLWEASAKTWPGNRSLTWTEIETPPSADRSRSIRRFTSGAMPLPAAVLKATPYNIDKATPEGSRAWHVYWTRSEVTPMNGVGTQRMYSTAQRRFVLCETGKVVDAGAFRFAALNTDGEVFAVDLDYDDPRSWEHTELAHDEGLRAEFSVACAPVLIAAYGDVEGRQRLAQLTKPPAGPSPRQTVMAARQALLDATRTQAAQLPDAAAAAPTQPGGAKARIRMFQQNGLEGGLTNEAACASRSSKKAGGGGFWKALGSTVGVSSNTSLGMPETETVRNLAERSKAGSKAYYVEHEVTAEMPVTVDYGFGSAATGQSCRSLSYSFVPEAGADYEARMDVGSRYCILMVKRILPGGVLLPEPIEQAPDCPPERK